MRNTSGWRTLKGDYDEPLDTVTLEEFWRLRKEADEEEGQANQRAGLAASDD